MLAIEQRLTCDICGEHIRTLSQTLRRGEAMQYIERGAGCTIWADVCSDCSGPLVNSIWALKAAHGKDV